MESYNNQHLLMNNSLLDSSSQMSPTSLGRGIDIPYQSESEYSKDQSMLSMCGESECGSNGSSSGAPLVFVFG